MNQDTISISGVKKTLDRWREIKRKMAEKKDALEKIKTVLADNTRRWEIHNNRIAELQKESNTITPADVEELRISLTTLSEEGETLNQMVQQVLLELKALEEDAEVTGKKITAIYAVIKELDKLFAEKNN